MVKITLILDILIENPTALKLRGAEGVFFMVVVRKQPGESDEALIRKFSRKVIAGGIIQEAKRREFYLKPSLAKKQKQEEARRMKKTWV